MEREVGGGIGMGNTCKPMADSFQCMTKPTTIKKNRKKKEKENCNKKKIYIYIYMLSMRERCKTKQCIKLKDKM